MLVSVSPSKVQEINLNHVNEIYQYSQVLFKIDDMTFLEQYYTTKSKINWKIHSFMAFWELLCFRAGTNLIKFQNVLFLRQSKMLTWDFL